MAGGVTMDEYDVTEAAFVIAIVIGMIVMGFVILSLLADLGVI